MPRWGRADGVLWRRSLGELVVLGDGEPLRLNATGAALWHRLAEPATTRELIADLAERFGRDPERIADDVSALLRQLADLGLVTRR